MDQIEKTGFLEESPGVQSSTRMFIFILLINGIILADLTFASGIYVFFKTYGDKMSLMSVCTAATTLLGSTMAGCMTWKQMSKAKE
jgi:hypothetical protein